MAADGGVGDEQLGSGVGETLQPGGGLESLQRIEGREPAAHVTTM
jgi:hypothetical protein